jgi:hypothetical protein
MAQAGYSKRTLVQKLGIKEGWSVAFLNVPPDYMATLGELPTGVEVQEDVIADIDFVQLFVSERGVLEAEFPQVKDNLSRDGMLWVSWPKRAAKMETDLDENVVREIGLGNGLVDVKVIAVDEVWSGLKFVRRLRDRT